jgi:hypothetical protein
MGRCVYERKGGLIQREETCVTMKNRGKRVEAERESVSTFFQNMRSAGREWPGFAFLLNLCYFT